MPTGRQRGRTLAATRVTAPARRAVTAAQVWWQRLGRRARLLVAAAAVALGLAVGIVAWQTIAGGPAPRARQYLVFTACLLTDSRGLAGPQSSQVWAGMEAASLATRAKVEYLPVMSGTTAASAAPYLASLVRRQCAVVIATGPAQVAAVNAAAASYPKVRFAVAGGASSARVTALPSSAGAMRSAVGQLIAAAVNQAR